MRDKIEKLNVTNAVMGELINQIISEQILPGEKFPSENEMADQFGVSRLTVCAAEDGKRAHYSGTKSHRLGRVN